MATTTQTKLICKSDLCIGDICCMTAAIYSLHKQYPGRYLTDVRTPHPAIWENNPDITPIPDAEADQVITCEYPLIHQSNQSSHKFINGYVHDLGAKLGMQLDLMTNKPMIYMPEKEKLWINQVREHHTIKNTPFWILDAGIKKDYTCKQYPVEYYQQVVDNTIGRVQWVQVGHKNDLHIGLNNVINLVGQTDTRQLIRLIAHCQGVLCPVTSLQHIAAAFDKNCICLLGGREPITWVSNYPKQHTLHTIGSLPCCLHNACWRSRVVKLNDESKQNDRLCEQPIIGLKVPVAKCMAMITPNEIVTLIDRILHGGAIRLA